MSEFTSLEVSKRLTEMGFKGEGGSTYWGSGVNLRYRSDILEDWLLNEPIFSKRPWSIHIAIVAEKAEDGTWKRLYRVAADCGDGSEICKLAPTLPDALAEVVMKVMEAQS